MKKRTLSYAGAIREAFDIALARDLRVFLVCEGIPDPKGAFGTTTGLQEKYGPSRVMDMPVSENGMTGVVIGAALGGMRPVLTHMRIDFSMLSMDQIINTAAKWFFMYGGKKPVPIVIRMIVGRGWGQGPQHSQSLQALFAHIPGLKVVMPATPEDAKGLLLASIFDNNPVIFIEHRWLHGIIDHVPEGFFTIPLGTNSVIQTGKDITIVASSHMVFEAVKAAKIVHRANVSAEIVNLRALKPFDARTILRSVKKTGRLLVADTGVRSFGVAAEVIAAVFESGIELTCPPSRITLPDLPTPTSRTLAEVYYPTEVDIAKIVLAMVGKKASEITRIIKKHHHPSGLSSDVPDTSFAGPF